MSKAPDKIYAGIYPVDNELRQEWLSAPMYGVETTEYIRKEAILKWAKECTASFQEQMDYHKEKSNAYNILVGGVSTIEMLTSFLESL